jgi:hypothetical protein
LNHICQICQVLPLAPLPDQIVAAWNRPSLPGRPPIRVHEDAHLIGEKNAYGEITRQHYHHRIAPPGIDFNLDGKSFDSIDSGG